jgi:hypothetical protein
MDGKVKMGLNDYWIQSSHSATPELLQLLNSCLIGPRVLTIRHPTQAKPRPFGAPIE